MSEPVVDFPIFDADNHMYETPDAFTKYLPPEYAGVIKYVEVNGRTKIAVQEHDQRLHPEPDVRGGGPARRPGGLLPATATPKGKSRREIMGEPMRRIGRVLRARSRASSSWTSWASTGR